jgi:hypothetical protein
MTLRWKAKRVEGRGVAVTWADQKEEKWEGKA